MRRVHVVCEGQTEETFVRDVIIPALHQQLNIAYSMVDTSPGHRGGALVYARVQKHLRNVLRQSSEPAVTTLFDLYRLDSGFPGFDAAAGRALEQRLAALTGALHQDIIGLVECPPERFIPYIQPYEFEALLFSDVPTLTSVEDAWAGAASKLQAVRDAVETPEHINDGPMTKPAAVLERHLTLPGYRKALHGPIAASRIGLDKIYSECKFFAAWLDRLRGLATAERTPG